MVSIGIVGVGFVGDAIYHSLTQKHADVIAFDKYKGIGNFEQVLRADVLFLCLPTLFDCDQCMYDKSALHEVCERLQKNAYTGLVVVKSTVEPGTTQMLAEQYSLNMAHNPEFLTARTARQDFHQQEHIVIGTTVHTNGTERPDVSALGTPESYTAALSKFIKMKSILYPDADVSVCTSLESECMKSFVNCFYAQKVQIFTEFHELCARNGADFQTVRNIMLKNKWINTMHTDVPGPDGQVSYGGACFPKDTKALLHYMKSVNSPCDVLEATVRERDTMRPKD